MDYRKTLKPRYTVVWRDIALCYTFLLAGAAAPPVAGVLGGPVWSWAVVVPAAVWIGVWTHALFLFGHEAAHSNLAPRRGTNDRLGDWLVWVLFGSSTAEYRRTHMAHHSHLGDHKDTEITYHLCLSAANALKACTGIRVLEVLVHRRRLKRERRAGHAQGIQGAQGAAEGRPGSSPRATGEVVSSLRSTTLHLAIAGTLLAGGWYAGLAAWLVGMACVFPLCATVRTIVEHRHLDAACSVDFSMVEHGPVNRLFGTDPLSRLFGSAGFNQHLLHHWDPAISYTCFEEMARFMESTPLAAEMTASRTSYGSALRTLVLEARRG